MFYELWMGRIFAITVVFWKNKSGKETEHTQIPVTYLLMNIY